MRGALKRHFARYRGTGQASALAEVFRLSGPELLGFARFISGSEDDAQDLLQETWLTAIEVKDRWDEERRLMPWLLGILSNQNHRLRARRRREAAGEYTETVGVEPDPERAAELREFQAQMREAIDRVREPFRTVLVLSLLQDKSPQEIAAELERQPVTVRGQLHRGLSMLRRFIPAGASAGVLYGVATAAVAQRIAEQTLANAARNGLIRAGDPTKAETSPAGRQPGRSAWGAGLGLLVVSLLTWALWPAADAVEPKTSPGSGQEPQIVMRPDTQGDRESLPSPGSTPQPKPAARAATGSIEIHFTWSRDGKPAVGVGGTLLPGGGVANLVPHEAVTDQAGVMRFLDVPAGHYQFRSDRRIGFPVEVQAGRSRRADLPISEAGLRVVGRVVDHQGHGVAGAAIWHGYGGSAGWGAVVGRSGSDGSFSLRDIPAQSLLGAYLDGFAPTTLREAEPRARVLGIFGPKVANKIVLTLQPGGGKLTGQVLDPKGRPLPDAWVSIGPAEGWFANRARKDSTGPGGAARHCRTGAKGRFEFTGLPTGWAPLRVRHPMVAQVLRDVTVPMDGTADVLVQTRTGQELRGCILDLEGKPLPGCMLRIGQADRLDMIECFPGPDGGFHLAGLSPGCYQMELSFERRVLARRWQRVPAAAELEWRVSRGSYLRGRLLDPRGQPCKAFNLVLRSVAGKRLVDGITDDEGRFRVGPLRVREVYLWAQAANQRSYVPCTPARPLAIRDEEQEIRADPDAWRRGSLRGRLVDAKGRGVPSLRLSLRQAHLRVRHIRPGADAQGHFHLEGLGAGRYELEFQCSREQDKVYRVMVELKPGENRDLGELKPQGSSNVLLNATHPDGEIPWYLRGELYLNGERSGRSMEFNYAGIHKGMVVTSGDHLLEIRSPWSGTVRQLLRVPPDSILKLDLKLTRGVRRALRVELPEDLQAEIGGCRLRILDQNGGVFFDKRFDMIPMFARLPWPSLPIGRHTVELELARGQVLRGFAQIDDLRSRVEPLNVPLK